MNWDVIYPVVTQWFATGSLPESDKPLILEAYTALTGLTFTGTCKKCQWSDVQHALRFHLIKVLKYPEMNNHKWMIATTAAFFQVHGLPYAYINKGTAPESDSAKHLTDEIAEKLLKEHEGAEEVIVKNPDYNPDGSGAKSDSKPAGKPTGKPTGKPAAGEGGGMSPQQKAAQTKAENKAKEAAEATAAEATAAEAAAAEATAAEATANTQPDQGTGTNE